MALTFVVPDDQGAGVYANTLAVWHTPYEFTLDFGVLQPASVRGSEDGQQVIDQPVRVTSRVRIPPPVLIQLLQALSTNLANYESRFGPVSPQSADGEVPPPDIPPASDAE